MMGIFRRLFAPKNFCVNFLIDSDNLYIKKQNIYTATEVVTLIPIIDDGLYDQFMDVNSPWVKNFLPNAQINKNNASSIINSKIRRFLEYVLSTGIANLCDTYLRNFYLRKLTQGKEIYEDSLKRGELEIDKGIFKGHRLSYDKKIITIYNKNLKTFLKKSKWEPKQFFYD